MAIVLAQQCYNHVRAILSVLPSAVIAPQMSYSTISVAFNHQILCNMVLDFDLR